MKAKYSVVFEIKGEHSPFVQEIIDNTTRTLRDYTMKYLFAENVDTEFTVLEE